MIVAFVHENGSTSITINLQPQNIVSHHNGACSAFLKGFRTFQTTTSSRSSDSESRLPKHGKLTTNCRSSWRGGFRSTGLMVSINEKRLPTAFAEKKLPKLKSTRQPCHSHKHIFFIKLFFPWQFFVSDHFYKVKIYV